MKNRSNIARLASLSLLAAAVLAFGACHESSYTLSPAGNEPGPYRLTFSLDGSFRTVHGGQPIRIAVVRGGIVVAQTSGTVSATQDPSFTFHAGAVMERWIPYEVHYWIDSNIGGGTPGLCDPEIIDHQWSTEFRWPTNDIDFVVSYQPALVENVCGTFV